MKWLVVLFTIFFGCFYFVLHIAHYFGNLNDTVDKISENKRDTKKYKCHKGIVATKGKNRVYNMENIKEKYWKNGNVFEFNNGTKRFIWNNAAIDNGGFIPKCLFNDELINTDSTVGECVIRIYSPNTKAGYFKELIETEDKNLLWRKSDYIYTKEELKQKLGISTEENLIIIS